MQSTLAHLIDELASSVEQQGSGGAHNNGHHQRPTERGKQGGHTAALVDDSDLMKESDLAAFPAGTRNRASMTVGVYKECRGVDAWTADTERTTLLKQYHNGEQADKFQDRAEESGGKQGGKRRTKSSSDSCCRSCFPCECNTTASHIGVSGLNKRTYVSIFALHS